ncbi:hypothetical protein SASPL_139778 [Salvia splendens]|uniref:RING-type E3 ubiquitin transferase n=1 Tax=Salvia splendens TaxID=180675 RepID=A0A8X8WP09_SALSN|nr:E3 ubiquitin-protein ligase CHFR-like [Salvia splendens]KAG6398320.1 hypothetical protein SASPL_139778 [Salvia splendens]
MDPEYYYHTSFSITKKAARTTIFPHLQINFNLSLHKEYTNYLINFETGPRHLPLPLSHRSPSTALIIVREHLSFDDVQEAVGAAIGDSLRGHERSHAILLAWERLLGAFSPQEPLPKYVELDFDMDVWTRYWYVHGEGSDDGGGMVPAAEEEIRMLEECDVAEEERYCSICLEELGVALRMPCSHVFHGGCIKDWLRKSHYCPLCRYQMPTATTE